MMTKPKKSRGVMVYFYAEADLMERVDTTLEDMKLKGYRMLKRDLFRLAVERVLKDGLEVHIKTDGGY